MSDYEAMFWKAAHSLRRWAMCALAAWFLLTLLLAGLQQAQAGAHPDIWSAFVADLSAPGFLMRMRELTLMTVGIWVWPTAALAVFFLMQMVVVGLVQLSGWHKMPGKNVHDKTPRTPGNGDDARAMPPWLWPIAAAGASAFKFGAMFFAGFAVLWSGLAVSAYFDGRDHWEALPTVTPPYLSEFLARHPGFSADRGTDTSGKLTLHDDKGHSVQLHGSELANAQARFDACPVSFDAEQLGGITPFAGAPCAAVLQLRNETGEHRIYLFGIASGSDIAAIEAHLTRLSDAKLFSGSGSSKSRQRYSFSASGHDNGWRIEVNAERGGAASIMIRHTVSTPQARASGAQLRSRQAPWVEAMTINIFN